MYKNCSRRYRKTTSLYSVEYEYYPNWHEGINYGGELKVDKNNTITIRKIKDSWNRKEVIELIEKFSMSASCIVEDYNNVENWIKENL